MSRLLTSLRMATDTTHRVTNADISRKMKRLTVMRSLTFASLLGLTWISGLFLFDGGSLTLQYIFTISVSLQGFSLFMLQCVANPHIRRHWSHYFCMRKPPVSSPTSPATASTSLGQFSIRSNSSGSVEGRCGNRGNRRSIRSWFWSTWSFSNKARTSSEATMNRDRNFSNDETNYVETLPALGTAMEGTPCSDQKSNNVETPGASASSTREMPSSDDYETNNVGTTSALDTSTTVEASSSSTTVETNNVETPRASIIATGDTSKTSEEAKSANRETLIAPVIGRSQSTRDRPRTLCNLS